MLWGLFFVFFLVHSVKETLTACLSIPLPESVFARSGRVSRGPPLCNCLLSEQFFTGGHFSVALDDGVVVA